ncbi:hypothetical protein [Sporosarcina newyorkensis]|uniref:hypothetical protein n=1 Tax=Sporosarcina newyorkensis TaxID=759851 RepID=UPI003D073412
MDQVLLDNADIDWNIRPSEPEMFRELWEEGFHIDYIAKTLKRTQLEVALFVIDQSIAGLITVRNDGVFGG